MELLLFLIGALSATGLILNNVTRTALRQGQMRLSEIGLAFFTVLMPVSALILNNLRDTAFDQVEQLMLLLIVPLAIFSFGLTIVELFRPKRLRQSRGLLGLGAALLIAAATYAYPLVSLRAQLAASDQNIVPTPVNAIDNRDPCVVAFEQFSIDLVNTISDASGYSIDELFDVFEQRPDASLATLIEENDGSAVVFTRQTLTFAEENIRDLLGRGCLDANNATAIIGGLRVIVPRIIYDDFTQLQTLLNENTNAEDISREDFEATRVALVATLEQEPSPLPTITPTPTPSRTPSPTPTRTPRATLSPTPTFERFVTSTPTATATLPNPCLATANFNVNMRDFPDLDESEVLQTIPFDSTLTIYAPNADKTWWFGQYDGISGWISAEFISTTSSCDDLPPRRP